MASVAIFSSLLRRKIPFLEAVLVPDELTDITLIQTLSLLCRDVLSGPSSTLPFQHGNWKSLIRKTKVFTILFDSLTECKSHLPYYAILCLRELYIIIYKSKLLVDYCFRSSRLWLLLQNSSISSWFHTLNQEISTILDVFPLKDLEIAEDIKEQIKLLHKQSRKVNIVLDPYEEMIYKKLLSFLDMFERGETPDPIELQKVFIEELGIHDAKACIKEIEFLEKQIINQEENEVPVSILTGFIALTKYCRFFLFGFNEEDSGRETVRNSETYSSISEKSGGSCPAIPKDFCCPISLDLMIDPVIISTGQTYDRSSISEWLEDGHCNCPKTGQMLSHTRLVPNKSLRNIISKWCDTHGVSLDPLIMLDSSPEPVPIISPSKAAIEANKATIRLLTCQLSDPNSSVQSIAAQELRFMAKSWKENRIFIAEEGAIPLLRELLYSSDPILQENSVTAILNLSIHEKNKPKIIEEFNCLGPIVHVLIHGLTSESRENAAAALFSLSAVHDYKKLIIDEEGAVETLARMLRDSSLRGKKDAVMALFNLSTHVASSVRMVELGVVSSLVSALDVQGVSGEAAGALSVLAREVLTVYAMANEDSLVPRLIAMMRRGTPKEKENAVAALLEICKSGVEMILEDVLRVPLLGSLLHKLSVKGTKRAQRKASTLMRMLQKNESMKHLGRWARRYEVLDQSTNQASSHDPDMSMSHTSSFSRDVSVSMAISLPVV